MDVRAKLRTLLRLFFLAAVLMSVAVLSAITTIRLTIHGRQETLPNLVGMPIEQAQRVAGALGLQLNVEDRLYSDKIPADAVVTQMPAAGTSIKAQQMVHVLLSLGPPKVSVPDLIGRSIRAAQITAVERGLTIGDVAGLYWPQGEPNQVVAQDPPPATTDLQSPAVNFLVSMGPQPPAYLCPDFRGKFPFNPRALRPGRSSCKTRPQEARSRRIRYSSFRWRNKPAGTIQKREASLTKRKSPACSGAFLRDRSVSYLRIGQEQFSVEEQPSPAQHVRTD